MDKKAGIFDLLSSGAEAVGAAYKKVLTPVAGATREGGKLSNRELIQLSLPLLGITAGAHYGKQIVGQIQQSRQMASVKSELSKDPEIARAEPERVDMLYETLKKYAPSISSDPLVAQSFVKGMAQYGHLDYKVVTDLLSAERAYKELKDKPFSAMQAVKNVSWLA